MSFNVKGKGIKEKNEWKNSKHYEFAQRTIDSWPDWKKEISEKVIQLATRS